MSVSKFTTVEVPNIEYIQGVVWDVIDGFDFDSEQLEKIEERNWYRFEATGSSVVIEYHGGYFGSLPNSGSWSVDMRDVWYEIASVLQEEYEVKFGSNNGWQTLTITTN